MRIVVSSPFKTKQKTNQLERSSSAAPRPPTPLALGPRDFSTTLSISLSWGGSGPLSFPSPVNEWRL